MPCSSATSTSILGFIFPLTRTVSFTNSLSTLRFAWAAASEICAWWQLHLGIGRSFAASEAGPGARNNIPLQPPHRRAPSTYSLLPLYRAGRCMSSGHHPQAFDPRIFDVSQHDMAVTLLKDLLKLLEVCVI